MGAERTLTVFGRHVHTIIVKEFALHSLTIVMVPALPRPGGGADVLLHTTQLWLRWAVPRESRPRHDAWYRCPQLREKGREERLDYSHVYTC